MDVNYQSPLYDSYFTYSYHFTLFLYFIHPDVEDGICYTAYLPNLLQTVCQDV